MRLRKRQTRCTEITKMEMKSSGCPPPPERIFSTLLDVGEVHPGSFSPRLSGGRIKGEFTSSPGPLCFHLEPLCQRESIKFSSVAHSFEPEKKGKKSTFRKNLNNIDSVETQPQILDLHPKLCHFCQKFFPQGYFRDFSFGRISYINCQFSEALCLRPQLGPMMTDMRF